MQICSLFQLNFDGSVSTFKKINFQTKPQIKFLRETSKLNRIWTIDVAEPIQFISQNC